MSTEVKRNDTHITMSLTHGRRIVADEDGDSLRYSFYRDDDGIVEVLVDLNRFKDGNAAATAILHMCGSLAEME